MGYIRSKGIMSSVCPGIGSSLLWPCFGSLLMSLSGLGASRRMKDVANARRGTGVKAARRESVRIDLRRTIVGDDVEGECVLEGSFVVERRKLSAVGIPRPHPQPLDLSEKLSSLGAWGKIQYSD